MKDASSTAVFGVRGANGVVLITTRRGKAGKTQISASTKLGLQQPISLVEQTGSYEFARFWNMKQEMDHVTNPKLYFTPEQVEAYRTGSDPIMYPSMDWKKYIFNNIYLQSQNNLNISGGSDNVRYFISVGYTYQNGLLKELPGQMYDNNYRYNRYNYRANIDANLTKTTSMKLGVGGVLGKIQEPRSVVAGTGEDQNPWVIAQIWSHPFAGPGFINGVRTLIPKDMVPLGEVMRDGMFVFYGQGYNQTYDTTLNLDLDITQKLDFITPGLSVSVKGAYDNKFKLEKVRTGGAIEAQTVYYKSYFDTNGTMSQTDPDYDKSLIYVPSGSDTPLTYSESSGRGQNWYLEGRINYDRTFGDHRISGLFLYNQSRNYYPDSYTYLPRNYVGLVGRATYAYQSKYLLDVNVGYNGSENFAPGSTRFGVFPSFSAGWNVAREAFMESTGNIINTLKIRGSWGELGNQNTENLYPYIQLMKFVAQDPNSHWLISNSRPNTANAPDLISALLGWETMRSWNIGFDLGMLNNRLTVSFDWFNRKTINMVGPAPELPVTLGANVPKMNNADMQSTGFELDLGWRDRIKDFDYGVHLLLSDDRQKILKYPNTTGKIATWYVSKYNGDIWGFETIGITKSQEEMDAHLASLPKGGQDALGTNWGAGDIMYRDLNGDGKISDGATLNDPGDKKVIGNTSPRFRFGLDLNASWKGFDVRLFFQGVAKRDAWLNDNMFWGATGGIWQSACFTSHLDFFREEGDDFWSANKNAYFPRILVDNFAKNQKTQTRYLQNAAYIRLKNLQIGYTIPAQITRKIGISNLRVFFSGENLFTLTGLPEGFDPETINTGYGAKDGSNSSGKTYPLSHTFSTGFSVNF